MNCSPVRLLLRRSWSLWVACVLLQLGGVATPRAAAQWVTESYPLVAGWNAIWLPLDCTYTAIEFAVPQTAIEEVWRWSPLDAREQFTTSIAKPILPDVQWAVWRRNDPSHATLFNLTGNAAYLIKVTSPSAGLTLSLKGKPLLPVQTWKSSGLNFAGFPLAGAPSFLKFLGYSADLKDKPPIYFYKGGEIQETSPINPAPVVSPGFQTMSRSQAYWVQSSSYSSYYGPLSVRVTSNQGIDFGTAASTATVTVKNVTDPAGQTTVDVTLAAIDSEAAPAGQPLKSGGVPLRLRGDLDAATGQYGFRPFSPTAAPETRSLAPGEERQFVVAIDRAAMGNISGLSFQSLLQVTDSLNLTRINIPVRAESTSLSGVWVGGASITSVDEILSRATGAVEAAPPHNKVVTVGGQPVQPTQPRSPFPVRLLVHATSGGTRLLQKVFIGNVNGTPKASPNETTVTSVSTGRVARLSSSSFPVELPATSGGALGVSNTVEYDFTLPYNARTNPFVHLYHPDHDNKDARFEQDLGEGRESYDIHRHIKLTFQPTLAGVSAGDPTWGSTTLGGLYEETISGLRNQPITVSGVFVLHRVSPVSTLSEP